MGYQVEWLVDDDFDTVAAVNKEYPYDEAPPEWIQELRKGETNPEDSAVTWHGGSASAFGDLNHAVKMAVRWQNPDSGAYATARIRDSDTGEIVWTSWGGKVEQAADKPRRLYFYSVNRDQPSVTEGHADLVGDDLIGDGWTLAEMKAHAEGWYHAGWEIQIVDENGDIVATSNPDGTWDTYGDVAEGEAGGEGPRDGETFPEYLARLRARQEQET